MVKFRLLNTTFHHCVLLSITKYFVTLQKLNFVFAIGLNYNQGIYGDKFFNILLYHKYIITLRNPTLKNEK
jgi:hypothetical protein